MTASQGLAPARRGRRAGVLRPGSRGPRVLALQKRLAELGYYLGEADGIYGELTEDAVRALQRAFRLQVDGVVGPEVFRLLNDPLLPAAPPRHLVVGWADALPEVGRGPGWISAWASPWIELSADVLGRIDPGDHASGRVAPSANGQAPSPTGQAAEKWLPIITLRLSREIVPLRGRSAAPLTQAARRSAPLGRVIIAAPDEPPATGTPGAAELPPPGAFRLARQLGAAGVACWLSLRILAPGRCSALLWWGYEVARRTGAFERLIVWAPGPETELERALSAVRAAVRGIRRWRPPWQVLLKMDLSPWLVEPSQEPGRAPARRRLTRTEAVLASWQLRLRRLRGEKPEGLPTLLRCTPERIRAFVSLVRWAGLGGVVLRGMDRADGPASTAIESRFSPLEFSFEDDPS